MLALSRSTQRAVRLRAPASLLPLLRAWTPPCAPSTSTSTSTNTSSAASTSTSSRTWHAPPLPHAPGPSRCTSASGPGLSSPPPKPVFKPFSVRPITKDDVEFAFSRSSGAGGQNVNKVSTKVDMRLDLGKATWIPLEIRDQIRVVEKNRVNNEGEVVVTSQKHRTQAQNMEDALSKLQSMIDEAVEALTPKIADEATVKRVKQNIKAGNEKRIQHKKMDSMKKQERSRKSWD